MRVAHEWGARYPAKRWAEKKVDELNAPASLRYVVRHNPSPRYPDAPWEVIGLDDLQAVGGQAEVPPLPPSQGEPD